MNKVYHTWNREDATQFIGKTVEFSNNIIFNNPKTGVLSKISRNNSYSFVFLCDENIYDYYKFMRTITKSLKLYTANNIKDVGGILPHCVKNLIGKQVYYTDSFKSAINYLVKRRDNKPYLQEFSDGILEHICLSYYAPFIINGKCYKYIITHD